MNEAQVTSEIDAICARANARREAARDPQVRALNPTGYDWMTTEERARLHELQLMLPRVSRAEARARVEAKRAARRAAMKKTAKMSDVICEAHALLLTDGLVHLQRAIGMIREARHASVPSELHQASEIAGARFALGKAEAALNVFSSVASTGERDLENLFRARTGEVLLRRARRLARNLKAFKRALDDLDVAAKLARKVGA